MPPLHRLLRSDWHAANERGKSRRFERPGRRSCRRHPARSQRAAPSCCPALCCVCSSLIELGGTADVADSLSRGMGQRVWPFTMDYGVPLNVTTCAQTARAGAHRPVHSADTPAREGSRHLPTLQTRHHAAAPSVPPPSNPARSLARNQFVNPAERWPGLWDIPVWDLSALGGAYEMDYGLGGCVGAGGRWRGSTQTSQPSNQPSSQPASQPAIQPASELYTVWDAGCLDRCTHGMGLN